MTSVAPLAIAMLLIVGYGVSAEPPIRFDEGPVSRATVAPPPGTGDGETRAVSLLVVCPDTPRDTYAHAVALITATGVPVEFADDRYLFSEHGGPVTNQPSDLGVAAQRILWLSGTDCSRAHEINSAEPPFVMLVLYHPPYMVLPRPGRFERVAVLTDNHAVANQYRAAAELYASSGYPRDSIVTIDESITPRKNAEITVATLLHDAGR